MKNDHDTNILRPVAHSFLYMNLVEEMRQHNRKRCKLLVGS